MKKAELLNSILVALLGLALGFWSFFAFGSGETNVASDWDTSENFVFDGVIDASSSAYATFKSRDSIRLLPGSEATLTYDESEKHFDIFLKKGSVVLATLAGDFDATLRTNFAEVDSARSTVFATVADDDSSLSVYGIEHPSLLTLVRDSKDLNSFYVPTSYRTEILKSKVNVPIAKLRLAKLSKEFQIYEFKESELDESLLSVLDAVDKSYENASLNYMAKLSVGADTGPALDGQTQTFRNVFGRVRSALTFSGFAENKRLNSERDDNLKYALSNSIHYNAEVARVWLQKWLSYSPEDEVKQALSANLFFVLPGDGLYEIKAVLNDSSIYTGYNELESLIKHASIVEASLAFKDYKSAFEKALKSSTFDTGELSRRYILTELLLRSNAVFYTLESAELLKEIETSILAESGSYQDLDEERQAFVQSRLRFLENLFKFVSAKKLSVSAAEKLGRELITSADDYLNSIAAQVAVRSYFEQKLEDYDMSLQYISSPEFGSYLSFDEGLAAFRQKSADLAQLNAYLQGIRSGNAAEVSTVSLVDATKEVEFDLESNGIQYAELASLGDAQNRLFNILGGKVSGLTFEGNYDRETKILYDVVAGDIKFATGLAVEKFRDVLNKATEDVGIAQGAGAENQSQGSVDSNLTEEVALSYAESQFTTAGLDISKFEINLLDLDENQFSFEGEATEFKIRVSGTYNANSNEVSEIVWYLNGNAETLPDLDLSNLESALAATYQALRTDI